MCCTSPITLLPSSSLHSHLPTALAPSASGDTKSSAVWRTSKIKASWVSGSPLGGELVGRANQLHQTDRRKKETFRKPLTVWGCPLQQIAFLTGCESFSHIRGVHEEMGRRLIEVTYSLWCFNNGSRLINADNVHLPHWWPTARLWSSFLCAVQGSP